MNRPWEGFGVGASHIGQKEKKKTRGGHPNIPFTLGVDTVLDLDFLDVGPA